MENLEVKTCWFIGQFSYGLFLCRQSDLSKWQLSIKEIKENQRGDDLAYKVGIGNGTQWVQFLSEGNPFWRTQSRASKFSFLSINSISYEIWYLQLKFETLLRSLRLKLWPQEVAKVAEVKAWKIGPEMLKSSILKLQKHNTPQKKAKNYCHSDLK